VYIDFEWIWNQWTHCFKNLQWPPPQLLCYSQMKHLWQVPQNFRCLYLKSNHKLVSYCSSYIRNLCNFYHIMVQGQTNHVKPTPVIYMHIIYSYSSHFDWLVSLPFHRKCQFQLSMRASKLCMWRLFRMKGVLRLLGSLILKVANVALWLCYADMPEWT